MKLHVLALACLGFCTAEPTSAKDLLDYDWIEVRTPHFEIASAEGTKKTRELAVEIENFRAMVEMLSNIGRFEERIPTKIYLLPRADENLGFDARIAGYFSPGMRANYAVIVASSHLSDETLKHEYTHFLTHNRDAILYPTWFDEGFAELLCTLRVRDGVRFEYGKPLDARASWLFDGQWVSSKTLLNTRDTHTLDRNRIGMFYAQSWLLVHYLMIGSLDFPRRNADFLTRRERGESAESAFAAAFGVEAGTLNTTLQRYLPKLKYVKSALRRPLPEIEMTVRPLPRTEISVELAMLAFRTRGAEAARPFYEAALASDADYAPALTGMGDLHKFAGRFEQAKPYYERAVALDPTDDNLELDYAEYFLDLASHAKDNDPDQIREHLVEARRHFARGNKLNPNNPEILAMNGATYLFNGEDAVKGVESLEAAHDLLPAQREILALLAQAYIASGEPGKARRHVERLLAWSHSEDTEAIQKLLDSVNAADPNAAHVTEPVSETIW